MKNNIRQKITTLFLLAFILSVLASCAPTAEQIATMTSTAITATAAQWTKTPTYTSTLTPTITSSPTITPTATNTPLPMPEYTWELDIVDDSFKTGLFSSLAINQEDEVHIGYLDDESDNMRHAIKYPGGWNIQIFQSPNIDGFYPSLAFDQEDNLHIVRYIIGVKWLAYMPWKVSGWEVTAFLPNVNVASAALAMDHYTPARPNILFFDRNDNMLKFTRFRTSGWRTHEIAELTDEGIYFPVQLDSEDQPHLCYYDAAEGLVYATIDIEDIDDEEAWQKTVVDEGDGVGLYSDLTLDADERPHISYYDRSLDALKHAWYDGKKWKTEIVDDSGSRGMYTSLAVGDDDYVHISYFDEANADLLYAVGKEGQWQLLTVDEEGSVGEYNSMALDSLSQPHISYYDYENRILKYAFGELK